MKDLVGRKFKGFKFDSTLDLVYIESDMDEYIGEVGEIESLSNKHVRVRFEEDWFYYPLDQIEDHLVPEYEIGKEYEFSDNGEVWVKRKLVGIINHEYKYVSYNNVYVLGYKQIREIKPKVKELTLEEIAEKFGCDVSEIKIKK